MSAYKNHTPRLDDFQTRIKKPPISALTLGNNYFKRGCLPVLLSEKIIFLAMAIQCSNTIGYPSFGPFITVQDLLHKRQLILPFSHIRDLLNSIFLNNAELSHSTNRQLSSL